MKYEVTHKCNCTKQVNLYGPNKERERKLNWLETINCDNCQEKIDKEQDALPTLTIKISEWSAKYKGYKQVPGSADIDNGTIEIYV